MPKPVSGEREVRRNKKVAVMTAAAETSLMSQAYQQLQEMIITLELRPGMLLSELQISELIGLGRSPVREAVQRLAREGLLNVHRARGIIVSPIDAVRQLKLLDVRRPLEILVCLRASKNASNEQREAMLAIAQRFLDTAALGDSMEFMRNLRNASVIKVEAADNEILDGVMGLFAGLSIRYWHSNHKRQLGSMAAAAEIHAALLRAIVEGDEAEVTSRADSLIDYLEAFTRRAIG